MLHKHLFYFIVQIEFRTAYEKVLTDKRMRLIIIVKGELPPFDKMDQELQTYLSLNTYLKYDDPFFMERLRYALPHNTSTIETCSRKTQAIKDQANQVNKPDVHLPLPLLADGNNLKVHVQLPPDIIEMCDTPTSSTSSTVPFFPNSPQ